MTAENEPNRAIARIPSFAPRIDRGGAERAPSSGFTRTVLRDVATARRRRTRRGAQDGQSGRHQGSPAHRFGEGAQDQPRERPGPPVGIVEGMGSGRGTGWVNLRGGGVYQDHPVWVSWRVRSRRVVQGSPARTPRQDGPGRNSFWLGVRFSIRGVRVWFGIRSGLPSTSRLGALE